MVINENVYSLPQNNIPALSIETRRWSHTARTLATLAAQTILFPWGLYELTRYITQRIIFIFLYPAQSHIIQYIWKEYLSTKSLDQQRQSTLSLLSECGFIARPIRLERDGVLYDGLQIGRPEFFENGRWVLQATGNFCPIELVAAPLAETYAECGYNTLLVNGPSVGNSQGRATPESMGKVQDTALTYLETCCHAQQIVLAGHSLGGAALSLMIPMHTFQPNIHYLVIRQMTFDRSANVCAKALSHHSFLRKFIRWCIRWSHVQMDSVAASKILTEKGIPEIIVQATHIAIEPNQIPCKEDFANDGVIPAKATLGYRLVKEGIIQNKQFIGLVNGEHNSRYIPYATEYVLQHWTTISNSEQESSQDNDQRQLPHVE